MKALIRELIETMRSLIRAIFALKDATDKMNESQKNHKEGAAATQTEMAAPNLFSEVKDADADEKPARKQRRQIDPKYIDSKVVARKLNISGEQLSSLRKKLGIKLAKATYVDGTPVCNQCSYYSNEDYVRIQELIAEFKK